MNANQDTRGFVIHLVTRDGAHRCSPWPMAIARRCGHQDWRWSRASPSQRSCLGEGAYESQ
jgi:hypothetical protein